MGYGRTIKESDLERLRPLFEALETLPEGKGITYTDHPLQISKDRTIIYTYWDIYNLKGIFKLMNPRPEEIKIIRLVTFAPAVDLADRLSEFTAPRTKAKRACPGFEENSSSRAAPTTSPGIDFYNQHAGEATNQDEFVEMLKASNLPNTEQYTAIEKWLRREKTGEAQAPKEPAEEGAQLPREQVPEGSGIEFYNNHADTTWPEIFKLVSTAQAAGELSDIEANQALTEWQRCNPEFKPSSGA